MMLLSLLLVLAAPTRPIVSVAPFENRTGDATLDVAGKGLADLLVTDLVAWDGVEVVERERLQAVLKELELQSTRAFDAATAVKVGRLAGAGYVLSGAMLRDGGALVVDARLVSVETGKTVLAVRARRPSAQIFELEQELAGKVADAIDAKLVADPAKRRRAKVPDLDALVAYANAIDLADRGQLAEAQAAMQAVVSKAPTFLLARARRDALLARFQAWQREKKDTELDAASRLRHLAATSVAAAPRLDELSEEEAQRYLALRSVHGRLLLRALGPHLSSHGGWTRAVLRGHEGPALTGLRAWAVNQHQLVEDFALLRRRFPNIVPALPRAEARLAQEARLGYFNDTPVATLARFVLLGQAEDGVDFRVAPALGFIDPKERTKTLDELERGIVAALKSRDGVDVGGQALRLVEARADAALATGDVDGAVTQLQRYLDAFPDGTGAAHAEQRVRQLLEGRLTSLTAAGRWARGLAECDGMDLLVGDKHTDAFVLQRGVAALEQMADAATEACAGNADARAFLKTLYSDLARDAAGFDDCALYQRLTRRALAAGQSVRDTMGWARRLEWCDVRPALEQSAWLYATRDSSWDLELPEGLTSSLAGDVLTLHGERRRSLPRGPQVDSLTMKLRREKGGWTCVGATFEHNGAARDASTCTATVLKPAAKVGEFDEGVFEVTFSADGTTNRAERFTDGQFRLERR